MSSYRETSNEAKAVRRGIVEPRPVKGGARRSRMAKTVVVEIRYPANRWRMWASAWRKFGAYPDIETANQVIDNKTRSGTSGAEYRIKP